MTGSPRDALDADALLDVAGTDDRALMDEIRDVIRLADAEDPRSAQLALGPSQLGTPCVRELVLGLSATEQPRLGDPLAAIIGTAAHAWMETAARMANERAGRTIWVPETRVEVAPGISGTCDLYHVPSRSALDWKFPGPSRFAHYRKSGPGMKYRVQAHLYGRGYRRLGMPVEHVGIIFVPKAGRLDGRDGAFLWRERYDDALVDETLARVAHAARIVQVMDMPHRPDLIHTVPKAPHEDCRLCDWWSPKPSGPRQCSGPIDPT